MAASLLRKSPCRAIEFALDPTDAIYSQGPYYCGVGSGKVVMRDVVESHYKACLCK